jgi:hypothetical protein
VKREERKGSAEMPGPFRLCNSRLTISGIKSRDRTVAEKVDIAVVTKTYAGQEGLRVKAGTRFAVGRESGGLPVITKARYEALRIGKLVRAFGEQDTKAKEVARVARPLARPVILEAGGPTARKVRAETRARLKQTDTPAAPKQVAGPRTGSQSAPASASSPSTMPTR